MKKILLTVLFGALLIPIRADAKRDRELSSDPIHVLAGDTRNADIATKGPITVDGVVNADITSFGDAVVIRGEVNGDIVAMGGSIVVSTKGKVNGDVVGLGATVDIEGQVSKDLVALGEEMTISSHAVIAGDVSVIGGDFEKSDGAIIKGEVSNIGSGLISMVPDVARKIARIERRTGLHKQHHREKLGFFGRALAFAFTLIVFAGLGAILMLMGLIVPEPIERMRDAIKVDFWKAIGFGFLVAVAFIPSLIFLAISVIGIPLVPLAVVLLAGVTLMGLASFSILLSERVHASRKLKEPETVRSIGLGFLVLVAFFLVGRAMGVLGGPFAPLGMLFILTNMMFLSVAVLLGLGSAVMTKIGTKEYVGSH